MTREERQVRDKAMQAVLEAVGAFYGVPAGKVSAELVEGFVRDVETRAKVAATVAIAEGG